MEPDKGGGGEDAEGGLCEHGSVPGRGADPEDTAAPQHHHAGGRVQPAPAGLPAHRVHGQWPPLPLPQRGDRTHPGRVTAHLHRRSGKCKCLHYHVKFLYNSETSSTLSNCSQSRWSMAASTSGRGQDTLWPFHSSFM